MTSSSCLSERQQKPVSLVSVSLKMTFVLMQPIEFSGVNFMPETSPVVSPSLNTPRTTTKVKTALLDLENRGAKIVNFFGSLYKSLS